MSSASTSIVDVDPTPVAIDGATAIDIPSGNDDGDVVANAPPPAVAVEVEGRTAIARGLFSKSRRALSSFSRQYDVNGDGKLDDAELAMRNMATSGRGYLTNEQVHAIVVEQMETHRKLFRTRRVMFLLLGLVIALALSNLGTSFAAAYLAKDVTTSSDGELTNIDTNEPVSTQTYAETIDLESTVPFESNDGDGTRRLCTVDDDDVECMTNSQRTMGPRMCDAMIKHCSRGNTVNLKRVWGNGDASLYSVCRLSSGTISATGTSRLKNSEGMKFAIERLPGGHCSITGDAVSQGLDDICVSNGDCMTGLICTKDAAKVEACKDRCDMLRFAPSRLPACYARCDHATCIAASE